MSNKRDQNLEFKLDDSSNSGTIDWKFHKVGSENSGKSFGYYTIIGLDIMNVLGLIINFGESVVKWNRLQIPVAASCTNL